MLLLRIDHVSVLKLHSEPVREEWLDAYGHLNEACYLIPFSNAAWSLQDHFGIGVEYFERTGGAIYTVESHLRYLKEVRAPAMLELETMIFDSDAKRLHFGHVMLVEGEERATFECVALHFDTRAKRTAPLPEDVQAALEAARIPQRPAWTGRRVTLEKQ